MKKSILILFLIASQFLFAEDILMPKRFADMTPIEINHLLKDISRTKMTNADKIVLYSTKFLNTPYDLTCEGDGPYALYDTQPLMNLKQTNCMCYVELVMAMSLSSNYEEMFNVLQHIRYRNGLIGMATRNHYTIADWLPANSWCLKDVTRKIGGKKCQTLTRTISHKKFFESKEITDIDDIIPNRTLKIYYIPKEELLNIQDDLHPGDIVSVIMDKPGIFSAHMGFIMKDGNQTIFRHASQSAMDTIDQPFDEYVESLMKNQKRLGMVFMRIREDVNWKMDSKTMRGKINLLKIKK